MVTDNNAINSLRKVSHTGMDGVINYIFSPMEKANLSIKIHEKHSLEKRSAFFPNVPLHFVPFTHHSV